MQVWLDLINQAEEYHGINTFSISTSTANTHLHRYLNDVRHPKEISLIDALYKIDNKCFQD
jgi:hypothetical protein